MPITNQQYQAWLNDQDAIRCILVEVDVKLAGGSNVTRYLSNKGYVTSPTDTPANTEYPPLIVGGVKFSQSISIDGSVSLSFGDLELNNHDGSLDSWLDDFWVNRNITVYAGDARWARADFRQIFTGVVTGVDSRSRNRVNLKLSDKMQRLNTPITETKLGGGTTNADQPLPLCFGECHNVEPLLVDQALHKYMVHDGPIEGIIEVRDNGVPVLFTADLSTGTFFLEQSPAGQITASVQGDAPGGVYTNNLVNIIKRLVKDYGNDTLRFTDADLDLASLNAFASANPQPVGLYCKERTNLLEAIQTLAGSVGGRCVVSPTGLLSIVKLTLPQGSAGTTVGAGDMVDRSLEIASMPPVVASVKVGYAKNWTVQDLQTGIVEEHRKLYAEEWLTQTRSDSLAATNFNLFTDPKIEETLLLTAGDAATEALRRLNVFNVQRKVFKFAGYAGLLSQKVGDPMTLQHSRFGLSAGKTGQILSITTDWLKSRVEIEVMI
jgi:hypothetical protein